MKQTLLLGAVLLLTLRGQAPEATPPASPRGNRDILMAEFRQMHAQLDHISNQHTAILVAFEGMTQRAISMQKEIDQQRAQIDVMDPSKAAERLVRLEDWVDQHNKKDQAVLDATDKRGAKIQTLLG